MDGGATAASQQQSQSSSQFDDLPEQAMLQNEREVVRRAGRQAISTFLDGHNCFSVLRASGKVVVFDTRIPIQLAFYALVEHGASESCCIAFSRTMCTRCYGDT